MAITPVKTLVTQAKEHIQTLLQEDAEAQVAAGTAQFIDIRDVRELKREGRIPGALNAPVNKTKAKLGKKYPQQSVKRLIFYQSS